MQIAITCDLLALTGRFDQSVAQEETVIGKKGSRGIKRKFEANEVSASDERESMYTLLTWRQPH